MRQCCAPARLAAAALVLLLLATCSRWQAAAPATQIDGHPLGAPSSAVHYSQPANSGPGSIYPSLIDVPSAGCWQFTLHWATGRAEIDLTYGAATG